MSISLGADGLYLNGEVFDEGSDFNPVVASSYGASGYVRLNDGLIIQWGNVYARPTNFPITFPNAVYAIVDGARADGTFEVDFVSSVTTSGFYANNTKYGTNSYKSNYWIAIGY